MTAQLEFHGIADAREKLSEIIDAVSRGQVHTLGRRKQRMVLMLPLEPYGRLFSANLQSKLALIIATQLLSEAPPHIMLPAIRELESLPIDQLVALIPTPTDDRSWATLQRSHSDPGLVKRLRKRQELCRALVEAQTSGIIDAAEHGTSSIEL